MSIVERVLLAPEYTISRVIKGGWQLAGGHGAIQAEQAVEDMRAYVEAGITTFDCADIYTGVEELIGTFLRRYREAMESGSLPRVQIMYCRLSRSASFACGRPSRIADARRRS